MKFFLIQKLNKNQLMSNIKMNTRRTTMLLKFKKHSNGWSIKKRKRGHADYQPFIRWYKNERALRIWYRTFYTRDFQF